MPLKENLCVTVYVEVNRQFWRDMALGQFSDCGKVLRSGRYMMANRFRPQDADCDVALLRYFVRAEEIDDGFG